MGTYSVTVDLPEETYARIQRAARGLRQPIQQALVTIVESRLPSLAHVPAEYRVELEAMESSTDEQLRSEARSTLPSRDQARMDHLTMKASQSPLDPSEEQELEGLHHESDRLMLRKSYAYLLLQWRGREAGRPRGF